MRDSQSCSSPTECSTNRLKGSRSGNSDLKTDLNLPNTPSDPETFNRLDPDFIVEPFVESWNTREQDGGLFNISWMILR